MATNRTTLRRFLILAALGLSLAAPATAQQPLEMRTLLDPARMGPVQFRIFSGRVTMQGRRLGSYTQSANSRGRNERLTLSANNNELVLSYESTSPAEQLSVEASGADRLMVRRRPRGNSTLVPVEYEQAKASVSLTVGVKDKQQVYQGASLWHLLIAHREVGQEHLASLLKVLNREWDLMRTAELVESTLLSEATARDLPDRRLWGALVERLGDESFSNREAADRQLREAGRAVVTYLRQIDPSRLDAEQRYRIRRIILAASAAEDAQSPDQVVAWLSGDPAIWLIFMAREEESTRRLAAACLEALLGKPIPFHPTADPATRKRELDALRKQISGG